MVFLAAFVCSFRGLFACVQPTLSRSHSRASSSGTSPSILEYKKSWTVGRSSAGFGLAHIIFMPCNKKRGRASAQSAASSSRGLLSRTALLVRTHNPTAAMLARIQEWEQSAAQAGCACFIVSVDVTHPPGRDAADALTLRWPRSTLHTYCGRDLAASFPVLEDECLARVEVASRGAWRRWGGATRRPGQASLPASLAWGFHAEAVNLWVCCSESWDWHEATWDFLWVLEDDVGCAGGDLVTDCLAAYAADDSSDLIGAVPEPVFRTGRGGRALGSQWCWAHTGSDAFLARVACADRLKAAEHVQRFSRRLLEALYDLAADRRAPVAAWSEMGTPTLCRHLGMRATSLRDEHLGDPFAFDGRVSEEDWERLCKLPSQRGRLFHALKF